MLDASDRWDVPLRELLGAGTITGYALLTVKGVLQPVVGEELNKELGLQEALPASVQQFLKTFNSPEPDATSFSFLGHKLLVFHQSGTSLYSLSERRQLGLLVAQLPFGVLLVTFGRATPPPVAISRLEPCLRLLRA